MTHNYGKRISIKPQKQQGKMNRHTALLTYFEAVALQHYEKILQIRGNVCINNR